MLLFGFFVAVALTNDIYVSSYNQIVIGENSTIPINGIACTPVWRTDSPDPSIHPGYKVSNIGKTAIQANIYWKDSWPLQTDDVFCEARSNCSANSSVNVWYELADQVYIEPSKSAVIKPSPKASFYFTRLVVVSNHHPENSSNLETIVNVEYENGGAGLTGSPKRKSNIVNLPVSVIDNLKNVFMLGGSKLPSDITVSGMEALIDLFWPQNNTSVWDEVQDKVKNLIDQETYFTIKALLTGRVMSFERKLEQLAREVKENQSDVSIYYMQLARDFIGLEEEAIIRTHHNAIKLNKDLLPVYSNIILMKAGFYSFGIKCHQKVGLTQQNLANLKTYFTDMIRSPNHGANQYISQIFRNQCAGQTEYDKEMYKRNKIKEHGYVPIWNNLLDHPGQELVIDEMFYSHISGSYYTDIGVNPPSSPDPLSAAGLSKGEYNEIQKFILYQSHDDCEINCCTDAIAGMKLILKNGDTFVFGRITPIYRIIELNGAYRIREIETRYPPYRGMTSIRLSLLKLNKKEWNYSVADEYSFGCPQNDTVDKGNFAKENYYIASIYAVFDNPPRRSPEDYPLLQMGVSYLPLESHLNNTVDENNWKDWTC